MTTDAPVLVVTSLEDVTADLVIAVLNERRVPVARIDPGDIGTGLTFAARIGGGDTGWQGYLTTPSRTVDLSRIRSLYYRRPGPWRFEHLAPQEKDFAAREAQYGLGGVLRSLTGCRYVNHPAAIARCDYKPAQLQAAAELGFAVPPTLIANDVEAARVFVAQHGPVVYKTFRGVPAGPDGLAGAVWTQRIDAADLDESVSATAHLYQQEIDKAADVRVTVVGRQVFASIVHNPGNLLDWRAGDWEKITYEPVTIPPDVGDLLHRFLARFGLIFGCFDLALDRAGAYHWIECNSNGQWGFLPDSAAIAAEFATVLEQG
jgi:ATP-grasp ribosomal peptide maturase